MSNNPFLDALKRKLEEREKEVKRLAERIEGIMEDKAVEDQESRIIVKVEDVPERENEKN